jgi:dTDP-4-amino-4,6-dideoxygalactose transaminase
MASVSACLRSGWLGYGPRCRSLEARFAARGGSALATSNCTAALHLAARAVATPGGNEVVVPAITFVSTAMAFTCAGYTVRLADVDPATGLVDPAAADRAITPQTRAVVAVHLFGQRDRTGELRALCDRRQIQLIEDCAHRLDLLDERGPLGDMVTYSFNATKEAPGGEGGLLWWRSSRLGSRVRAMSNLGLGIDTPERVCTLAHRDYEFSNEVGLKLRGNDVSAALTIPSLDRLTLSRDRRRELFRRYDSAISPLNPVIQSLQRTDADSYLMYVVRVQADARDALRAVMAREGVATAVHYPSLSRHPRFRHDACPVAERMDQELLTLPCFPDLTDGEQERVLDALATACRQTTGA